MVRCRVITVHNAFKTPYAYILVFGSHCTTITQQVLTRLNSIYAQLFLILHLLLNEWRLGSNCSMSCL